jgi:hypothetical protein
VFHVIPGVLKCLCKLTLELLARHEVNVVHAGSAEPLESNCSTMADHSHNPKHRNHETEGSNPVSRVAVVLPDHEEKKPDREDDC